MNNFLKRDRFDGNLTSLKQVITVTSVQEKIFSFMKSVKNIKEDVFGKDALELLDLKK